jgi:hypothetical protein
VYHFVNGGASSFDDGESKDDYNAHVVYHDDDDVEVDEDG